MFQATAPKLKISHGLKSASGSRLRRKAYSPARLRRAAPQKRQRKEETPAKKQPTTTVSPQATTLPTVNEAQINSENVSNETRGQQKETVTANEISTSDLPLADNVATIRELLDKDSGDKILDNILHNIETEEKSNPTLSALNIELVNAKQSPRKVKRNFNVRFSSDVQYGHNDKDESRKFTCSKCGVTVSSRTALTFHYNAKHLNNNNSANATDGPMVCFVCFNTSEYKSKLKNILFLSI